MIYTAFRCNIQIITMMYNIYICIYLCKQLKPRINWGLFPEAFTFHATHQKSLHVFTFIPRSFVLTLASEWLAFMANREVSHVGRLLTLDVTDGVTITIEAADRKLWPSYMTEWDCITCLGHLLYIVPWLYDIVMIICSSATLLRSFHNACCWSKGFEWNGYSLRCLCVCYD